MGKHSEEYTRNLAGKDNDQPGAFLFESDGQVIYQVGELPTISSELAFQPGVADPLRDESGATYLSAAGDEHVNAFSPVAPLNWYWYLKDRGRK